MFNMFAVLLDDALKLTNGAINEMPRACDSHLIFHRVV